MANTRELRRRIKSVKNTSQITKAMQMVAATKMRRAQNQALGGRPYNLALNFSISSLLPKIDGTSHPLLSRHPERSEGSRNDNSNSTGVVMFSTNKALCGALNTNLFRAVQQQFGSDKDIKYFSVGLKGRNFLVRTGKTLEADFENPEVVMFREARQISNLIKNAFLEGIVKEVYIAFPDFVSTLRQEPKIVKLLPMDINSVIASEQSERGNLTNEKIASSSKSPRNDEKEQGEFLFEPDTASLLDFILNHFLETKIYQAMLETKASEHSARMMAMQNATDNALELVDDLNLTYNQTRQDAITKELLEITTAALALE